MRTNTEKSTEGVASSIGNLRRDPAVAFVESLIAKDKRPIFCRAIVHGKGREIVVGGINYTPPEPGGPRTEGVPSEAEFEWIGYLLGSDLTGTYIIEDDLNSVEHRLVENAVCRVMDYEGGESC